VLLQRTCNLDTPGQAPGRFIRRAAFSFIIPEKENFTRLFLCFVVQYHIRSTCFKHRQPAQIICAGCIILCAYSLVLTG
ncbi:hypothetical protein LJC63_08740, partial [Ruminococcaceae bacterium OttesenSCG-928-L11]|nr:hypothetical protein [Ruminococcaceae bacterium OttesenSCG-928-L11]